MQRGKDYVQRYDSGGELMETLKSASADVILLREATLQEIGKNSRITIVNKIGAFKAVVCLAEDEEDAVEERELAGHIVDQLRGAYDELLLAPIPDHLHKLLAELAEAEDKS